MKNDKMAVGKSIKMYLTIFVATTCIYMVLYQYHVSREPLPATEIIRNKDISAGVAKFESIYSNNQKNITNITSSSPSSPSSPPAPQSLLGNSNKFLWTSKLKENATTKRNQLHQKYQQFEVKNKMAPSPLISLLPIKTSAVGITSIISVTTHTIPTTQSSLVSSPSNAPKSANNRIESNKNEIMKNANATIDPATTIATLLTNSVRSRDHPSSLFSSVSSSSVPSSPPSLSPSAAASLSAAIKNKKIYSAKLRVPVPDTVPPPLYIITPTYRRAEQLAELTRLGYTLKHIANLLWLVIEDANKTSELVTQTLNRIQVPYEYLVAPMPVEYKNTKKAKPRGVSNRNRGLSWLRANATEGVFYFADDDNTYDITIFEQMRYTKKVSMWPVGLVTKYGVSSPIIRKGKIDGFYDGWIGGRKYPVDMAGFAVSVKFLHERPHAKMPFKPGYEEDGFLKSLAPLNNTEIELLASECTEILTWHTQTKKNSPAEKLNQTKYQDTNLVLIDKLLVRP